MIGIAKLFSPRRALPAAPDEADPLPRSPAVLEMATALVFALEQRDGEMELGVYAARVAEVAERLARAEGVDDDGRAVLRRAALLHCLGMIGAPRGHQACWQPRTPDEWNRARAQAEFAAAVAAAACGERAATLIRHQHDDEDTLRARLGEGSDACRLARLLRAAAAEARAALRAGPSDVRAAGDGAAAVTEQAAHDQRLAALAA